MAKLQIAFTKRLKAEEKAAATVEKYGRDLRFFALWLGGRVVTQDAAAAYKRYLTQDRRREAAGVNSSLATLM